jgi:hypothetical protein
VATDRVLRHRAQFFAGVGLRENGMAQGVRLETALWRFFDRENYFSRRSYLVLLRLHFGSSRAGLELPEDDSDVTEHRITPRRNTSKLYGRSLQSIRQG